MNTAISEAMSTGLPVIATNHGGFSEQVPDGIVGYIAEEGNPEDIARTLCLFFDRTSQWPALSEAARKHALAKYDRNLLIKKQVTFYKGLIKNSL